ncbi:hypothetical protein OHA77_17695 [Streptosporangium sp. NBC_01639]|uniref:hypothetical protein n=1 Tax=Streptosporangium sp. NBC_01639 TaxID=2975948 RepID=UPI00386B7624|nr:hypothetical protein OHA77_17695 [Streptosporangium sp. NBC_01639]
MSDFYDYDIEIEFPEDRDPVDGVAYWEGSGHIQVMVPVSVEVVRAYLLNEIARGCNGRKFEVIRCEITLRAEVPA